MCNCMSRSGGFPESIKDYRNSPDLEKALENINILEETYEGEPSNKNIQELDKCNLPTEFWRLASMWVKNPNLKVFCEFKILNSKDKSAKFF